MKREKGKALSIVFIDAAMDLTETQEVFDPCEWFARKDRPPVSLLSKGKKFPLLLAMMTDHTVAVEGTTFDGRAGGMNFTHAFAMMRHGVDRCGRLIVDSSN